MAAVSITMAAIVNRVQREFGRMTTELEETLPEMISEWFSEICAEFPYWFLTVQPGNYAPSLFPFNSVTPNYTFLAENSWIDVGWFASTANQDTYYFSIPDDLANPLGSTWRRVDIGGIEYVKVFGTDGGRPRMQLNVADHDKFNSFLEVGVTSHYPRLCTLGTLNNQGFIRIAPAANDNTLIFSVSFRLRDLPRLETPEQTNPLFTNYPQVAILAGLMFASQYFGDMERYQVYYQRLHGDPGPMTGKRNTGLLGVMRKDTIRRRWQRSPVAECWTSPPYSTDRRIRYSTTDGFYINP